MTKPSPLIPPTRDDVVCRVCLAADAKTKLISPCLCDGKRKYAHLQCLLESHTNPSSPTQVSLKKGLPKPLKGQFVPPPAPEPKVALSNAQWEQLSCKCSTCNAEYVGDAPVALLKMKLEALKERKRGGAVVHTTAELADLLQKQGNYVEAVSHYKAALSLNETSDSQSGIELADLNHKLACCYKKMGHRHFAVAESHFRRALQLRLKDLGPGHADVATCKHHLAMLLHTVHRADEALELAETALEIRQAKLGPDHNASKLTHELVTRLKKEIRMKSM